MNTTTNTTLFDKNSTYITTKSITKLYPHVQEKQLVRIKQKIFTNDFVLTSLKQGQQLLTLKCIKLYVPKV
jgi:hypothetical protein